MKHLKLATLALAVGSLLTFATAADEEDLGVYVDRLYEKNPYFKAEELRGEFHKEGLGKLTLTPRGEYTLRVEVDSGVDGCMIDQDVQIIGEYLLLKEGRELYKTDAAHYTQTERDTIGTNYAFFLGDSEELRGDHWGVKAPVIFKVESPDKIEALYTSDNVYCSSGVAAEKAEILGADQPTLKGLYIR